MAITLKSTLLDLGLTEDDVEAHVLEIIQARPTGAERRSALSYIRQLVQRDEDDLEVYRALIARARSVREDREILHTFDIRGTKHANLFTVATGVDYETPLTVANSEIIAEGATIVPAGGASRIVISANYVSLHGIGSGSAVDQTLQCGCIVSGGLSVSGSNVLVEGVDFKPVVDYTVIFTGTPTNIVFRNCRFDGALYVAGESTFFYGLGFAGSFTLENCEIKNYTSWMLADLNSDGTVQTGVGSALTNIVVKDCRFFDCRGSFAARGIQSSPTESAKITGNTWGYSLPFTATSMHPSFWNAYEVNNCKEVVCKQNTFAGTRLGGNGVRGLFQCWSSRYSLRIRVREEHSLRADLRRTGRRQQQLLQSRPEGPEASMQDRSGQDHRRYLRPSPVLPLGRNCSRSLEPNRRGTVCKPLQYRLRRFPCQSGIV